MARKQLVDNSARQLLRSRIAGSQMDFGIFRRLIGLIDPGEVLDFASQRLRVETLRIASNARVEWGIDEDLDEIPLLYQGSHHSPLGTERRNERT